MEIFNISVINQQIVPSACTMYAVAGEVNYHAVQFTYDDHWSDALFKLVAFTGSNTTIVLEDEGKPITVPWEVLASPGYVHIGVIGYDNAGRQVITTAESIGHRSDIVVRPESLSDDVPEDPTPSIWQQILMQMGDLSELDTEDKSTLVAAINEIFNHGGGGTSDHRQLTNREAADQHPISAITGLSEALSNKQDNIADLDDIREGAEAGGSAVQPEALDAYRTSAAQDIIDGGKVGKSAQAEKTSAMTQAVGIDTDGKLWTTPGGGFHVGGTAPEDTSLLWVDTSDEDDTDAVPVNTATLVVTYDDDTTETFNVLVVTSDD